jgi:hypothetical protein
MNDLPVFSWYVSNLGAITTMPATAATDGTTVVQWQDQSTNDVHLHQPTAGTRPTYWASSGTLIDLYTLGNDDMFISGADIPIGLTGTMVMATDEGTAAYEVILPADTQYDLLGNSLYFPSQQKFIKGLAFYTETLASEDVQQVTDYFIDNVQAGTGYEATTNFASYWRNRSEITSFPLIDTSAGLNFNQAFMSMSNLTTMPLIDMSNGTTFRNLFQGDSSLNNVPLWDLDSASDISSMFKDCTSLTTVPLFNLNGVLNMGYTFYGNTSATGYPLFDTSTVTDMQQCWRNNTSLTEFPAIDAGECLNFSYTWFNCKVLPEFPLVDVSKGTNFIGCFRDLKAITAFPALNMNAATSCNTSWYNCSLLADFPNGMFETSFCTNYTDAWFGCALTAQSVENILVAISGSASLNSLTNGTIDLDGGTSATPNATALLAKTYLEDAGWIVTTN